MLFNLLGVINVCQAGLPEYPSISFELGFFSPYKKIIHFDSNILYCHLYKYGNLFSSDDPERAAGNLTYRYDLTTSQSLNAILFPHRILQMIIVPPNIYTLHRTKWGDGLTRFNTCTAKQECLAEPDSGENFLFLKNKFFIISANEITLFQIENNQAQKIKTFYFFDKNPRQSNPETYKSRPRLIGIYKNRIYFLHCSTKQILSLSPEEGTWHRINLAKSFKKGLLHEGNAVLFTKKNTFISLLDLSSHSPSIENEKITLDSTKIQTVELSGALQKCKIFDHYLVALSSLETPKKCFLTFVDLETRETKEFDFSISDDFSQVPFDYLIHNDILYISGTTGISETADILLYDLKAKKFLAKVNTEYLAKLHVYRNMIYGITSRTVYGFPLYPTLESIFQVMKNREYKRYFSRIQWTPQQKETLKTCLKNQALKSTELNSNKNSKAMNTNLGQGENQSDNTQGKFNWSDPEKFPDELLLYIFSFLKPHDIASTRLVCKQFNAISQDNALWKSPEMKKYFAPYTELALKAIYFNEKGKDQEFLDALCQMVEKRDSVAICIANELIKR